MAYKPFELLPSVLPSVKIHTYIGKEGNANTKLLWCMHIPPFLTKDDGVVGGCISQIRGPTRLHNSKSLLQLLLPRTTAISNSSEDWIGIFVRLRVISVFIKLPSRKRHIGSRVAPLACVVHKLLLS